jgi:hypothetical protein
LIDLGCLTPLSSIFQLYCGSQKLRNNGNSIKVLIQD